MQCNINQQWVVAPYFPAYLQRNMQRLVCGSGGHRDLQVGAEGGQVVAAPLRGGEGLPRAVLQPRLQPRPLGGARSSCLPEVPRPIVSPTDGFVGKPAGVRREFVCT